MTPRARKVLATWSPIAIVTIAFVVSRLVARVSQGLRFDSSSLAYFLQYAPVTLLRDDLLRTVASLHHQAPLPSFVVGVAMKLSSQHYLVLLDALNCGLGLIMALSLLATLRRLGVGGVLRAVVIATLTATPIIILYEMWLFYHQLVATALAVATLCAVSYAQRPTFGRGLALFGMLAVVAYTRSIYGGVWFVAAIFVAWLALPNVRRRTLIAAAGPLLIVMLLPLKTKIQTGGGGYGDAMLWPNLSTKVYWALPSAQRDRLVEEGVLSRAAPIEAFWPLSHFEKVTGEKLLTQPVGVRVLDDREAGGQQNKQNLGYMEVALRWNKPDAKYLLAHYPREYFKSSIHALTVASMRSAIDDIYMRTSKNRVRMKSQERAVRRLFGSTAGGQIVALLILAPLGVAYGLWTFLRTNALVASQRAVRVGIGFATMTIAYTSLSTAFVSYADFSRYRFEIDPLYFIVWTVMAAQLWSAIARSPFAARALSRWRSARAPHSASPSTNP